MRRLLPQAGFLLVSLLGLASGHAATQAFNYTGLLQQFIVPTGVTSLTIAAYGGQGGFSTSVFGGAGGPGELRQATIATTPGEILYVHVGQQGATGLGGSGGASTDVRQGGDLPEHRVVVAAGGNGAPGSNPGLPPYYTPISFPGLPGQGPGFTTPTATNVQTQPSPLAGNGQVVLSWTQLAVATDAELRTAILDAQDGATITFAGDITLAADLPAMQADITIDGAGHALDGAGTWRGLFFAAWTPGTATFIPVTATVRNLTIRNCRARCLRRRARGLRRRS